MVASQETPDGKLLIREKGKRDFVIFEYRTEADEWEDGEVRVLEQDVSFLLERTAELERRCETLANESPPSIELAAAGWNLDRARKRFARWYAENDRPSLVIAKELRPVARRALSYSEVAPKEDLFEILIDNSRMQFLLQDYEARRLDKPPLIVSEEPPSDLQSLLDDANEAYRLGLDRAAVALCRALLEESLERIVEARGIKVKTPAGTARWEPLPALIDAMPAQLLGKFGKEYARTVKDLGKKALHTVVNISGGEALHALDLTTQILAEIVNAGGLPTRNRQRGGS
jgi:hypothetical protein